MRMDNSDKSRYPKFAQYVRCALPEVVNVRPIVRAFQKYGQIDRATLKRALAWDAQPRIEITDLEDAFGEFNGSIDANLIKIDTAVVEDFEAGRGIRKTRSGHPVYLAGLRCCTNLCIGLITSTASTLTARTAARRKKATASK